MTELPGSVELPEKMEKAVHHMLPPDLLHDLRTPLGHILGYSELLIEQMQSTGHEEFIPFLEKIRGAGRELLVLMQDNFQATGPPVSGTGTSAGTAPLQAILEKPAQTSE